MHEVKWAFSIRFRKMQTGEDRGTKGDGDNPSNRQFSQQEQKERGEKSSGNELLHELNSRIRADLYILNQSPVRNRKHLTFTLII